jgi:hypothetical protein
MGWGNFANKDGRPRVPETWLATGLPDFVASVSMTRDRTLVLGGHNGPRLEALQHLMQTRKGPDGSANLYPVKELAQFEGHGSVVAWAGEHWGPSGFQAGLGIFYVQSWAFISFLHEGLEGKYRAALTELVSDLLSTPFRDSGGYLLGKFKDRLGIAFEDDWKRLDAEFRAYVTDVLAKASAEQRRPPDIDDWPGYVDPDLPMPDWGK